MVLLLALILVSVLQLVSGHGRLIEPPSRSSMWRYGFKNPPNFNDHELYCGGFTRLWQTNGGKCGICGDPYDEPQPRDNEGGGHYGRGTITRVYEVNQDFKVKIELTANHMGYFEFRLCPQNNPLVPASQACLDRYLLEQTNGQGARYYPGGGNQVFEVYLRLPHNLTCVQCVLQWRYFAANNWGVCEDGSGRVGCGPQEEFRACSDVSITDGDGQANSDPNHDVDVINEVEDNSIDWTGGEYPSKQNHDNKYFVPVIDIDSGSDERTAVIVLSSLLTALLLFAAIFLYYYKLRNLIQSLNLNFSFPSLPSIPNKFKVKLPSLKTISVSKLCQLDKLSMPSTKWPLSNISLLPSFVSSKTTKVRPEISAPIPIPPPRTKRGKSRCTSPDRLEAEAAGGTKPPVKVKGGPLEISNPTEVTINGVTVGHSGQSVMGRVAHGPTPSSRGVICGAGPVPPPATPSSRGVICQTGPVPSARGGLVTNGDNLAPARTVWAAHPALVMPDQPDSSLDIPPPLPDCPPPEDSLVVSIDHDNSDTNNTDA